MVALRKRAPARMTVDEFLTWDPGDASGRTWHLVDREPVAMAPDSENHAAPQEEIGALIREHSRANRPSRRLVVAPGWCPASMRTATSAFHETTSPRDA